MVVNEVDDIVLINPALEKLFDVSSHSIEGEKYDLLIRDSSFSDFISEVYKDKVKSIELTLCEDRIFEVILSHIKGFSEKPWKVIVFHDITHMKKIQKLKSDVVSMVSHELRTPLTSIIGFADILMRKELDKDKRKKYVSIIQEESTRLLELINKLLDLSKLEAGYYEFRKDWIDIIEFINKAVNFISTQSDKHSLKVLVPDYCSPVIGDGDMLYQVIVNLLGNAIKYSPAGGNIVISLFDTGNSLEVSIEDEGIGIPADVIPRLFEKFYRGNEKIISGIKGTGLGLANVKYILEAHGGSINVESELDKGSRFTFYLPKEGKIDEY
jgi:signal transduction histidine kinase